MTYPEIVNQTCSFLAAEGCQVLYIHSFIDFTVLLDHFRALLRVTADYRFVWSLSISYTEYTGNCTCIRQITTSELRLQFFILPIISRS